MTPKQFKTIRESLGTQKQVADALKVTSRSIYNYENDEVPVVVELAITNPRVKKLVKGEKISVD